MTRRNRRPRPKARKPKYLSLRRYLAPPPPPALTEAATASPPPEEGSASSCCDGSSSSAAAPLAGSGADDGNDKGMQLLEPSPLQPPDHVDRDPHVASLLLLDDDNRTLEALFEEDDAAASSGSPSPASAVDSPVSSSMNWDGIARRALRGRERWAYCHLSSALPFSSSGDEEASSAGGGSGRQATDLWRSFAGTEQSHALTLKLDYEEILAAWSDRGPLYIEGEAPQVVPQLDPRCEPYYAFPVMVEVGPSEAWRVPEFVGAPAVLESRSTAGGKGEPEVEAEEGEEKRSREERVRRYKEKRRSRLFAKRIRYEVRKLNAEKRPRFKGRFIKRKDGAEDLVLSP